MNKKKIESSEDFIGWKSDDGLLEVVGIYGKQGTHTTYKVICHKCKEDKELFPDGYFVSTKGNLVKQQKPCGCAFNPKWTKEQFLLRARRSAQGRFIVHGFSEEFHGAHTKLNLECLVDGHRWLARAGSIINNGFGCPECAKSIRRRDEQEALEKCKEICRTEGYEPIGFVDGYKNCNTTRFEYRCIIHGIQNVSYNHFVNDGRRCRGCYKERQKKEIKEKGNGNGYYPNRKDEQDFLYVLNFNDKFLKVGRSFDIKERIGSLRSLSKIKKIHKLRIFTATHQEIYDLEQELHNELRERGFQHYVSWSSECFESDCLFILNKLLDSCGTEELYI
jgi:hypothetical protein